MNRRDFLKRMLGAGAAVLAGPVVLEVVKKLEPRTLADAAICQQVLDRIFNNLQMHGSYGQQPVYDLYISSEAAANLLGNTCFVSPEEYANITKVIREKICVAPY